MSDIPILFKDTQFEHDIYELIRAFYPGDTIKTVYPQGEDGFYGAPLSFVVEFQDGHLSIQSLGSDGQPLRCAQAALSSCLSTDGRLTTKQERLRLRKENKDRIKSALYQLLKEQTGKDLPWGNLTGIRPAKLAMGLLEEGKSPQEAAELLEREYFVSGEKACLAAGIAKRERELLAPLDYKKGYSLYIGIPFCPSICLYCSFSSSPLKVWEKQVDAYVDTLCREIREVSQMMQERGFHLDTLYMGGGTPTSLSASQLERLLSCLQESFDIEGALEFTLEAGRPDSITREKLSVIRSFPVSRISINPQTMNQKTLDLIGRHHTVEEIQESFGLARELGFDNINMDIILGLPGEGREEVEHTLSEIRRLGPQSLTVHTLAVKRAARLNLFREQYLPLSSEDNQDLIRLCAKAAGEMGMVPYYLYRQKNMRGNFENVGYAQVDKAAIYNILIMEEMQSILAVGASGTTRLVLEDGQRVERVENVKDVKSYLDRIDEMIERKRQALRLFDE